MSILAGQQRVGKREGRTDMDKWRSGGLAVRNGTVEDLDAIARLERDSFAEDQVSPRSLAHFLRAAHKPVIVAVMDGEVAGYALLSLRKDSRAVRVDSIAVDPRFARRGAGSALLQACEKYARSHTCFPTEPRRRAADLRG